MMSTCQFCESHRLVDPKMTGASHLHICSLTNEPSTGLSTKTSSSFLILSENYKSISSERQLLSNDSRALLSNLGRICLFIAKSGATAVALLVDFGALDQEYKCLLVIPIHLLAIPITGVRFCLATYLLCES